MADSVVFITGRAGSGKSRRITQMIRGLCEAGERCALIVPEQFTFETERSLSGALGGGLLYAEVFSLTTLTRRILADAGVRTSFLSPQGRRIIVRRVADDSIHDLRAFAGVASSAGFSERVDELITRCKQFQIAPEQLEKAAAELPEGTPLAEKLIDLSLIYKRVQAYMLSRYLDDEDAFNAAAERIPQSFVKDAHVFIDGFSALNGQTYAIINALMQTAKSLAVAIQADLDEKAADKPLFRPEAEAMSKLCDKALERGLKIKTITLRKGSFASPELEHLERNLFAFPALKFDGEAQSITVFNAVDRHEEVEAAAAYVTKLVRGGMRYREISVIMTDAEAYATQLTRVFSRENIPYFIDQKHPIHAHPAVELTVGALRAVSRGFVRDDVIRLIKTGLTGLTGDEADRFENLMLQYGLRGKRLATQFPDEKEDLQRLEGARARLMEPLNRLRARVAGATAREKTEALFAYLEELNVRGQLQELVSSLYQEGRLELMEENAQVWRIIMELFSQLHAILGEQKLGTARYADMVEEGFNAYSVGVIPTTADQVLLGTIGRTRARNVRAALVLGCNEGLLPVRREDSGVIDDRELGELLKLGINAWGGTESMAEKDMLDIYSALGKASEKVWFSYVRLKPEGEAAPAALIDRVQSLFPSLLVSVSPPEPVSSGSAFPLLVRRLRDFADSGVEYKDLRGLYACFTNHPEWHNRLRPVEDALYHNHSPEPFGRELAASLYSNRRVWSASRLEAYNACPFRHFAQYGLKAAERAEYRERAVDKGAFYHEALNLFTSYIIKENLQWTELTRESVDTILAGILTGLLSEHNNGVLMDTARGRAEAARMSAIVKDTAWAITRQIQAGAFTPVASEAVFGDGGAFPPLPIHLPDGRIFYIHGKIDRLDAFEADERYFRVIDYKSGGKSFSFSELYAGLSLQLPLYLAAVLAAEDTAKAAGVYYLPVREPRLRAPVEEAELENALLEQFRLRGLSLREPKILRAADSGFTDASCVLTVKRNRAGGYSGTGLMDGAQMEEAVRFATAKAGGSIAGITGGRADAAPYRLGARNACAYCPYVSACRFDPRMPSCRYRDLRAIDSADVFFDMLCQDDVGGEPDVDQ